MHVVNAGSRATQGRKMLYSLHPDNLALAEIQRTWRFSSRASCLRGDLS